MTTRPRVLVFATHFPVPVDRGDKNRLFHTLELLSSFAEVRLACLWRRWEHATPPPGALNGMEVRWLGVRPAEILAAAGAALLTFRPHTLFRFGGPRVSRFVRRQVREFRPDVLWVFQLSAYGVLRAAPATPLILDLVDSPSLHQSAARSAKGLSRSARLSNGLQWRVPYYEHAALHVSRAVLVSSEGDLRHLRVLHPQAANLHLFENCVPRVLLGRCWHFDPFRAARVLFVGNLAYPPNDAAVRWLAKAVMPIVRRELPTAELIVSGARGSALARDLADVEGCRLLGFVDDLVALHLESSVLAVPVPLATGTQYKLLEGLALGMPVVASTPAATAGGFRDGTDLLVADAPEAFARAVVAVCRESELAERLSMQGRLAIQARLVWEDKADLLRRLVYRS